MFDSPACRLPNAIALLCLTLCFPGCARDSSGDSKLLRPRRSHDTAAPSDGGANEARLPLVVFLGDSITAGLDLPAEQAFPARVQQRLAARGLPFRLANAGVSGDTSAGGLRRVDGVLRQNPALVVVELGANDGLRGLPLPALEQNLRAIVTEIRGHGTKVLLLGMLLPPSYGEAYTSAFAALYPRLAKELDIALVPSFMEGVAGEPSLNLPDGIHPTAEGHARLADRVADAVAALLEP